MSLNCFCSSSQTVQRTRWSVFSLLLLSSLLVLPQVLFAQVPTAPNYGNRTLDAVALPEKTAKPQIDGTLNDEAWKVASKADTFIDRQTSQPVGDQTDVFITYDKDAIYLAFYCRDSQPNAIVARETVRDAELRNDDHVVVNLDPFLTYKFDDYSAFSVNARGTKRVQGGGGRAGKLEWQGDWDAAAKRTSDGWTAEMRIPWGILPYPRSTLPINFGINFLRTQQRTQITSWWSDLGPQFFNERAGLWKGVQAPIKTWKPRLSFLPYVMPMTFFNGNKSQARFGVDMRYQPTPELTGVATLNPDFASVEGAIEGIQFSRSERFVPDRRPFFLEGNDFFDVGRPYQLGILFNPATIGQFDAGAKLYGKMSPKTTLGLLSTVDAGNQTNMVAQVRQEINPTSNVNFMMMQRLGKGEDNTVLAIAPNFRMGKWGWDAQYVQSLGVGAGGAGWTVAGNLQDRNMFGTLRYRDVAGDFQNRLGFIPFNDYKGLSGFFNWSTEWRKGFWRGFETFFFPTWDWHQDGRPFRRQAGVGLEMQTRSDYSIGFNVEGGKFDNDTDFTYGISLGGGVTNRFRRWQLGLFTGQQANLPYTAFSPSFSFRVGKRLDLIYSAFIQSYQGASQQHIVTFNYELNPFQSWGGRVVMENSAVNFYLSYRNAGRRGTDTYFIIGDPNAASFVPRVMFKLVFAF